MLGRLQNWVGARYVRSRLSPSQGRRRISAPALGRSVQRKNTGQAGVYRWWACVSSFRPNPPLCARGSRRIRAGQARPARPVDFRIRTRLMAAPRSFNVDHRDSPAERGCSLASEPNVAAAGSGAARAAAPSRAGTAARRLQPIQFFTLAEVAKRLSVSGRTVRRWIERGELIAHRFGAAVRIAETLMKKFYTIERIADCGGG
jgi:excisionase family DNA binding protein